MQKGRIYRQVLPHNLTIDSVHWSAPVRMQPIFEFYYGGNHLDIGGDVSETLAVDLPTMSIQWKGHAASGLLEFGWLVQQRLFDHLEGMFYRIVIIDNFGGMLDVEQHWTNNLPPWHNEANAGYFAGVVIAENYVGNFSRWQGCNLFCIPYSAEH